METEEGGNFTLPLGWAGQQSWIFSRAVEKGNTHKEILELITCRKLF